MIVYDSRRKPVELGRSVGRGGEATVYRIEGFPGRLAKIFEPAPRPTYPAKLSWMMEHPPENPTEQFNHPSLAWPSGLLYDNRQLLVGYWMPYIQPAVPLLDVYNPHRRARVMPKFNRRYIYRAARNLTASVASLHRSGYIIGDLNESNVLVTQSALVTLIDTDSFQVQEQGRSGKVTLHYCPVGKLEYTPPELQGKPLQEIVRLPEHDDFSLAVLIFQLLMDGSHPFRAQWLGTGDPPPLEARIRQGLYPYEPVLEATGRLVWPPKNAPNLNYLHPAITDLFRACFVEGFHDPVRRPTAMRWHVALLEAEDALAQCASGHYFSAHLGHCPICPPDQHRTSRPAPAASAAHTAATHATHDRASDKTQPTRPAAQPSQTSGWKVFRPAASSQAASGQPAQRPAAAHASPFPGPRSSGAPAPTFSVPSPAAGVSSPASPKPWRPRPAVAGRPVFTGWPSSPGQPSARRSWPAPYQPNPADWLRSWVRPRIAKSFLVGGSFGALAGTLPGALLGLTGWSAGNIVAWYLLWALGGAAAGIWRGWQPSYRLGLWVRQHVGWERFWVVLGSVVGGVLGTLLGLFFWWAIFPIFAGLIGGIRLGARVGRKIWLAGMSYGWERLGALGGSITAAALGGVLAGLAGSSLFGAFTNQSAQAITNWLAAREASFLITGLVIGGLGGALGGAVAGIFSDLVARLSGLVD